MIFSISLLFHTAVFGSIRVHLVAFAQEHCVHENSPPHRLTVRICAEICIWRKFKKLHCTVDECKGSEFACWIACDATCCGLVTGCLKTRYSRLLRLFICLKVSDACSDILMKIYSINPIFCVDKLRQAFKVGCSLRSRVIGSYTLQHV